MSSANEDPSEAQRKYEKRQRERAVDRRLFRGLPSETVWAFEDSSLNEDIRLALVASLKSTLRDTTLADDFAGIPPWDDGTPIPVADFLDEMWATLALEVNDHIARMAP